MLAATIVTICLLVFSGIASAQGNSDNAFGRFKEVREWHTANLMTHEGVVGTAVESDDQGRDAVLVLPEKPGVRGIPRDLKGAPVQ